MGSDDESTVFRVQGLLFHRSMLIDKTKKRASVLFIVHVNRLMHKDKMSLR